MDFSVQKKISNFVEAQFPQFYQEEGENFILFTKAYYEWMETSGQPIAEARSLFDYRDIDNTLESFLEFFQKKYLYGIPFNIIINKRFLLKHILDVYRSKGTIQCYKLLFKLIYDQDIEVYLPGLDILKPSDSTWVELQYIEVVKGTNLGSYVGKTVIGVSSKMVAVVESFTSEPINRDIVTCLFVSNVLPRGGKFLVGEKIVPIELKDDFNTVVNAPVIAGSLSGLNIENGGQEFNIGDIIKIVHRDLDTGEIVSRGVDGRLKVTALSRSFGELNFKLEDGGFGYTPNTNFYFYNGYGDTTGVGGTVSLGDLSYTRFIEYNTDLIVDFRNRALNSATFEFPKYKAGNNTTTIAEVLSYQTQLFGTIATMNEIHTGENYTLNPNVFVRSSQLCSNVLPGTISYNTGSNTITGTGTLFQGNTDTVFFRAGDVIYLQGNTADPDTFESQVIKTVNSNTSITLYGPPKSNSTTSAIYKVAPVVLPSNFGINEEPMLYRNYSGINGKNERITASPSSGNNIIYDVEAIDSGKGYLENESVSAYLYNGLVPITIINSGTGYANNEAIIFAGGGSTAPARGYVTTDNLGKIKSAVLSYRGSNYTSVPSLSVRTVNGTGAILRTEVSEYNRYSKVNATVKKTGLGRKEGFWSTTRGFLNSDKYIQDSYFYQDYSYQIKAALNLDKYKEILYDTFHTAGAELFGVFYQKIEDESIVSLLYEPTVAIIPSVYPAVCDSNLITCDATITTADQIP